MIPDGTRLDRLDERQRKGNWSSASSAAVRLGASLRERGRLRTTRALTASLAVSLGIQLANVLTGVLLARALTPHDRGALAAVILWPALLATVGGLGLPDAVTFHAASDDRHDPALLGTSLLIALGMAVAMVSLALGVVPLALHHYGSATVRLAFTFSLVIPLNLVALTLMAFLNGRHHYSLFHMLRLLVVVLQTGSIAGLALLDRLHPSSAVYGYLAANAATCGAALIAVVCVREARLSFSGRVARQLLLFGAKSQTSSVSSILNERLDQLVISAVLAPTLLGLYVVAVSLTSLVGLIGSSVAMVALPVIARLRTPAEQLVPARRLIQVTLVASTAVVVPMCVATPWLLELFFGGAYRSVATPTRILLVAAILLSTGRALSATLKAINRPLQAGVADGIALAVTIVGLGVLLPLVGLTGAALASLIAYGVSFTWMAERTARSFGVSWRVLVVAPRRRMAFVRSSRIENA